MTKLRITIIGDVTDINIPDFSTAKIPAKYVNTIKKSDLFIVNLEGPIAAGKVEPKFELSENRFFNNFLKIFLSLIKKRAPIVYSSPKIIELFKLNRKSVVTLANNHIKDLGKQQMKNTLYLLKRNKVFFLGANLNQHTSNKYLKMKIKEKMVFILNYNLIGLRKYGLFLNIYGATKRGFGAAYLDFNSIKKEIESIRRKNHNPIIILVLHAGKFLSHSIKRSNIDFKRIDSLGADVNIIHHSHTFLRSHSKKSFFLGDFLFFMPNKLPENRIGSLLTLEFNNTIYKPKLNLFNFDHGYPTE